MGKINVVQTQILIETELSFIATVKRLMGI